MKNTLLQQDGGRTYSIVMETGDDVVRCLATFARNEQLSKARFKGLGGLRQVLLGCFELDGEPRVSIVLSDPVALTSFVGHIDLLEGGHRVEPHAVLTNADGSAWGGRILAGQACPSLEILLSASD